MPAGRRAAVDYDASDHVITAASTVVRFEPRSPAGRTALFLLVHWGFGSAVAAVYPTLRLPRAAALALFHGGCQVMALTLFPTLGGTPPPWRWRRSMLNSSSARHAVYAVAVDATDRMLGARAAALAQLASRPVHRGPRPSGRRDQAPTNTTT